MNTVSAPASSRHAPPSGASGPLYLTVRDLLADKITSGEIAPGTVLREAAVARQLGVSRAPVRRALALLTEASALRGLDGGGHVVGLAAPVALSSRALSDILADDSGGISRSAAWERIFDQVSREITECMPFGSYRIHEVELGNCHGAGRTVAREVLWRLADRRLIHKDRRSHWIAGQMSARDIRETFEMRAVLEPAALRVVAAALDRDWLRGFGERIAAALDRFPACGAAAVDRVEDDLHLRMLEGLPNARMLGSIRRNQVAMVVPRLFRAAFPLRDDRETLRAAGWIVQHLLAGAADAAAMVLKTHLERTEQLTLARLRVLSIVPPPAAAPYLVQL